MEKNLILVVIILAVAVLVTPWTGCTETIEEILSDSGRFDGAPVSVRGVMKKLRTHVNKKGVAYYTFYIFDDVKPDPTTSPSLLVIAFGRPSCQPATVVKVEGRFYRGANYIDASAIYCETD
jgi:hypothetical protein